MGGILTPLVGAARGQCGPSKQETDQAASTAGFAQMLQSNYAKQFGQQQDVLSSINRSLSPILAAGPSQQGFSASERAALNTQAINSAGATSKNAQQAAANFGAGQGGGGSSGITSGVQKQIEGSIASSSANQLATSQNQITQADFAQGNANYWKASGGMDQLAAGYSPNASMSGATTAGGQAFGEANTIYNQQQQENKDIGSGIASAAEDLAGGIGGGISGVANSAAGASQPGAFVTGFFNGLG